MKRVFLCETWLWHSSLDWNRYLHQPFSFTNRVIQYRFSFSSDSKKGKSKADTKSYFELCVYTNIFQFFSVWIVYLINMVLVLRPSNCSEGFSSQDNGTCQRRVYFGLMVKTTTLVDHGFTWYGSSGFVSR